MTSLSTSLHACTAAALALASAAALGESVQPPSADDQPPHCEVIEADAAKIDVEVPDVFIAADLTHDGIVDISDVLLIFEGWGPCLIDAPCATDISPLFGDGATDFQDLLYVLSHWGIVGE
jgi:hypothetical protein